MERQENMQEARAVIFYRLPSPCKEVKAGRSFLRRLIDLSTKAKKPDYFICLSKEPRSDIKWWLRFSESWKSAWLVNATHIRCIRRLGMRGLLGFSLVLSAMGGACLGTSHHSKGAGPHRNNCCYLGGQVVLV